MSTLYTGSAAVMNDFLKNKSPLTSLVYASALLPEKQKKAAYALLMGTLRYKSILEEVLEVSNFMSLDRKMNRSLVLLMLYDLLLGESHAVAGGGVVKKLLMAHANHVRTAFVRLKIRRGAQADEDLLPEEIRFASRMPRYVRINTLRTTVEHVHEVLASEGFKFVPNEKYEKQTWIMSVKVPPTVAGGAATFTVGEEKKYYLDSLIPNLLVFAPGTDLHAHSLLGQGMIILQDKASCMPASVLDPCAPHQIGLAQGGQPWHVLDACAAPGNKTTHLLAIALEHLRKNMTTTPIAPTAAAASTTVAATPSTDAAAASSSASSQSQARNNGSKKPRARRGGGGGGDVDFEEHGGSRRAKATGRQVDFRLGGAGRGGVVPQFKLEAFEVDPTRFQLLHKMMSRALPTPHEASVPAPSYGPAADGSATAAAVICPPCPPATVTLHNRSFLDLDPLDPRYAKVHAILLDPTCSGSGMLHRIEQFYKHKVEESEQRAGKKASAPTTAAAEKEGSKNGSGIEKAEVVENVEALAAFQKEIVQHAMKFPNVQIVCYSTCSVHAAEDECVVDACLSSESGRAFGMSPALPKWFRRGTVPAGCSISESEASKCVRVAGAQDGMNGFFVARFLRKDQPTQGATSSVGKSAKGAKGKNAAATAVVATKPAAVVSSAPVSSKAAVKKAQVGQKRSRDEEEEEEDDEADEATASASTPATDAVGSQSKRNKKKREKAKLKKMRTEEAAK